MSCAFGRRASTALAVLALGGCMAHGVAIEDPGDPPPPLAIPEGHMPPPGQCRIWYPDLPAGQQPPPGDCYELERRVPPGAILVRG